MSSHVHLVLVPEKKEGLARALKRTHGRYASYWNALYRSSGHVWEGRYYSCPLDPIHLWQALRYTELNPVRAGLAAEVEAWKWSSAAIHCGKKPGDGMVDLLLWRRSWTETSWDQFLRAGENPADVTELRRCTFSGRPMGSSAFIDELEHKTGRRLAPTKWRKRRHTPPINDKANSRSEASQSAPFSRPWVPCRGPVSSVPHRQGGGPGIYLQPRFDGTLW